MKREAPLGFAAPPPVMRSATRLVECQAYLPPPKYFPSGNSFGCSFFIHIFRYSLLYDFGMNFRTLGNAHNSQI